MEKDARWVAARVTGHNMYVKMCHMLSGVNTIVLKDVEANCAKGAYQGPAEKGGLRMNRTYND